LDRATTKLNSNGISVTGTDLQSAYAFGGGAQIALNRRISFRVQADYFATEHSATFLGWEPSHVRVAGGIVIRVAGGRDLRQIAVERRSNPKPSPDMQNSNSNVEPSIAEAPKPAEAIVASVPSSASPTVTPATSQPVQMHAEALLDSSRQTQASQQQSPMYTPSVASPKSNPPAVMAGVVILTPAATPAIERPQAIAPPIAARPTISNTPPKVVAALPVQQVEGEPVSLGEYARRVRAKKNTTTTTSSW
jgi:hypothetical protein